MSTEQDIQGVIGLNEVGFDPDQADIEAMRAEIDADRAATVARCKSSAGCAAPYGFDWTHRVPAELRPENCEGRCLCDEARAKPFTIECDFSLQRVRQADGTWTDGEPLTITLPGRTTT